MKLLRKLRRIFAGKTQASNPLVPKRSQITVLVVDDDPQFLESVRALLRHYGFSVLTSNTGTKSLEMLNFAPHIHVLLLDYQMPRFDGLETLKAVRKYWPTVKVVGTSGIDPEKIDKSFFSGVDWFLRKPFKEHELVDTLDRLFNLDLTEMHLC